MNWLGHELPEWANWIARNENCAVYAFEHCPVCDTPHAHWGASADVSRVIFVAYELDSPVDWTDSLVDLSKLRKQPAISDSPCASDRQAGGNHYKEMGVEPWDVVDTWPQDQRIGYYRGGALKYVMRMGSKDASNQEIEKGIHYLEKLLEVLKEKI